MTTTNETGTGTDLIDLWDVGHDAAKELRFEDARRILAPVWAAVRDHAEKEGGEDYLGRADAVSLGEDETWAWPYDGPGESPAGQYVSARGSDRIVCEIFDLDYVETDRKFTDELWEEIREEWCEAFARGYKATHDAA